MKIFRLFLVVHGQGWVRDGTPERISLVAGQAAFWEKGEWHAAGTVTGLMAIVIESDFLDPAGFMPLK